MRKLSKRKESMDFIKRGGTFRQVDDEGKLWEEIEFDGYPYMVSKIDTSHFMMIPKTAFENRGKMGRPATYHVSEFNHMPEFYSNLRQWLKGGEMIGGKSFDESVEKKNKDTVLTINEEVTIGDYILEKGDRIRVIESSITDTIGEANFYLIDLLMDIYANMDMLDYTQEIKTIESITGKNIEQLFTFSIKQFAYKPSYKVSVKDYEQMNSELFDVTGKSFYTDSETNILSNLYY